MCKELNVFDETIKLKNNTMLKVRPDLFEEWDFDRNEYIEIYNVTKGSNIDVWWKCRNHQNHGYKLSIKLKVNGVKCKYCSNREILIGYNDMWSTNPKLAFLLYDSNDGYRYMQKSHSRVDWKCPDCGDIIKNKKISDVNVYGLSCPNCSDGISYPEKIIINILKTLGIKFEHQKIFKWAENKRYDFYLPNYNMIIEVHGGQHENGGFKTYDDGKTLEEEILNDLIKYDLAIENNIKNYIIIDAKESDIVYMKNSIVNGEFSKIFNMSNIDWILIEEKSRKSISFECLTLWNEGHKDLRIIADMLNIHKEMVRRYLIKWSKLDKCDYDKYKKNKRIIIQLDESYNFVKEWESITQANKYFSNKNKNMKLSKVLNGTEDFVFGYRWMFKESYEHFIKTGEINNISTKKSNGNLNNKKSVAKLSLEGEFIATYPSIVIAGAENGIKSYHHITSCCKGKREVCGGFKWMYKEDYDNLNKAI